MDVDLENSAKTQQVWGLVVNYPAIDGESCFFFPELYFLLSPHLEAPSFITLCYVLCAVLLPPLLYVIK